MEGTAAFGQLCLMSSACSTRVLDLTARRSYDAELYAVLLKLAVAVLEEAAGDGVSFCCTQKHACLSIAGHWWL